MALTDFVLNADGEAVRVTLSAADEASQRAQWAANAVPTPAQVNAERDRRIVNNFVFGGKSYRLNADDKADIIAFGARAKFAVLAGFAAGDLFWGVDPTKPKGFIATDNSTVAMDAPTASAFADAADLWYEGHRKAARTIKNISPIPADFAADSRWP